ncbi:HNH homing endonuclease [Bacillus phage Thurquoise]|nr:HNH homing endonuclease [Bacillus phage Thurquoise]
MSKGRVMSEDMYNHIVNNVDKLKSYDLVKGTITTVKNSHGSLDKGYLRVKLNKRVVLVHQILAVLLFGEACIGKQVNHKNGNKLDNSEKNLEAITQLENIHHAIETGLYENSLENIKLYGESHGRSKLTEDEVREIRFNSDGISTAELSRRYSVDRKTVRQIRQGITWKHIN